MNVKVIKKNNTKENWDVQKIISAVTISSQRAKVTLNESQMQRLIHSVEKKVENLVSVTVLQLHEIVMDCLYDIDHKTYTEYKAFRNYKERFTKSFANTYDMASKIVSIGDNENANKDSTLNSTKQALISEGIMKELMINFELKPEWVKAHLDGWVYLHDLGSRFLRSQNCCLFDMGNVLKDGFNLMGVNYSEPGGVQSALDIAGDLALSASAQQYGGFSIPELDVIFEYYADKTYTKSYDFYMQHVGNEAIATTLAEALTIREIEQGYQAFETKLNTISNSLGQTPFITISFGLSTTKWGRKISETILKQRIKGLGLKHSTAVFQKLVFLPRKEVNGSN